MRSRHVWDATAEVSLRTAVAAAGWGEWAAVAGAMVAASATHFTAAAVEARARKLAGRNNALLKAAQASDKLLRERRSNGRRQKGREGPPPLVPALRGPGSPRKRQLAADEGGR